jgi:hypothetical protein
MAVERFTLSGIVLVGHCAGTVSALHAGSVCQNVRGLVLLDPYFHLQKANPQGELMRAQGLPGNANLPLIECWNQVTARGIPILVLTAPSFKKTGEFDYLGYLQKASGTEYKGRVVVQPIADTPHSFAEGPGKDSVREHIEGWLGEYFPLRMNQEAFA